MTISPQKILILSDGVPGHVNQARGLASWMAAETPCETTEVESKIKHKYLRPLLRTLLNQRSSMASKVIRACHTNVPKTISDNTIILSCGGNTSFLNAALALEFGNKNIFIGSLRRLRSNCFSAVMTIEPVAGAANNVVMDFAPSYIDHEAIGVEGQQYLNSKKPAKSLWVMLIGGNGAGYEYTSIDWQALATAMQSLAAKNNIQWLVTSSRRTDPEAESIIEANLGAYLFDAIWFSKHGSQSLKPFLGAAEQIFCTEDSMTMLSESINSGKPVISVRPLKSAPNQRFLDAVQRFEQNNFLRRQTAEGLNTIESAPDTAIALSKSKQAVLSALNKLLGISRT